MNENRDNTADTDPLQTEKEKLIDSIGNVQDDLMKMLSDSLLQKEEELETERRQYMRNLSIVSGVTAPFSLLLLEVESLEIVTFLLVIGFILLLTNILVPQIIELTRLNRKNNNLLRSNIHFDSSISALERLNRNRDINELFKFAKNYNNSKKILNDTKNYITADGVTDNVYLQRDLNYSLYFLIGGVVSIILSISIFPIINTATYILAVIQNF